MYVRICYLYFENVVERYCFLLYGFFIISVHYTRSTVSKTQQICEKDYINWNMDRKRLPKQKKGIAVSILIIKNTGV